jgi:hypothetical protein
MRIIHGFITEKQSKEYSKNGHTVIRYPLAGAYYVLITIICYFFISLLDARYCCSSHQHFDSSCNMTISS